MASALPTILAGSWVGLKLFNLSRRTGQAPECYIGVGMLSFGAVAYPHFMMLVVASRSLSHPIGIGVSAGANAAYIVCLLTTALFTRVVFRPTSAWSP
jgi:Ca2+/Na+ antiporter